MTANESRPEAAVDDLAGGLITSDSTVYAAEDRREMGGGLR